MYHRGLSAIKYLSTHREGVLECGHHSVTGSYGICTDYARLRYLLVLLVDTRRPTAVAIGPAAGASILYPASVHPCIKLPQVVSTSTQARTQVLYMFADTTLLLLGHVCECKSLKAS